MLYVLTAYFNPMRFRSRKRLYENFAKYVAASGAQLLTVEAAFGDRAHEVTRRENPWHIQLRTDQILWHKEQLINLGREHLRRLAPDAKYMAWIDADVTFANPNWAEDTIHALQRHKVVQLFSHAINLDSREAPMWTCPSTFYSFLHERGYHQEPPLPITYIYKGHPGLAWAIVLEIFDLLEGLYRHCVAGSGDTVMANCLKGAWNAFLPCNPSKGMARSMQSWAEKCQRHVRGNVGYVPGACLHHWHGKSEERGYEKRWSILTFHQYDPETDIALDANGLFKWAGNKPRLEDDIRMSLTSRNEDAPSDAA